MFVSTWEKKYINNKEEEKKEKEESATWSSERPLRNDWGTVSII